MAVTPDDDGSAFDLDTLRSASSSFEADRSDLPPSGAALLTLAIKGEVEVERVRLLPLAFREPAYQAKGPSLVNSREFGLGLRLYIHLDRPLADWERTLLWSTGRWDELRSRLGGVAGIRDWLELGEYILPAAVTRSVTLDQLSSLQLSTPERAAARSGIATVLQALSVGMVIATGQASLPANVRQGLMQVLPLFADQAAIDPVLEKRLIFLSLLGAPMAAKRLPIGPSTIRLDPAWLDDAPSFLATCGEVPQGALRLFSTVRGFITDGVNGIRDTRTLLSFVQHQRETFFLEIDRKLGGGEALGRFLEAPNAEFRDPARFAVLEAFPDPSSYDALAGLFKSAVPFRLDDLEANAFKQAIAADPEHALEVYIELVDRAGVLETFLTEALASRPQSLKLKLVCDALERWRIAARNIVMNTPNLKGRISEMNADLTKKASLATMVRLSASAAEGLEGLERAGHEPETPAEQTALRRTICLRSVVAPAWS
jgi:hypothetical protein